MCWFTSKPKVLKDGVVRKAVVVGINKYPGAPLEGCVNDATNIKAMAVDSYGFDPAHVMMITDGDATTRNIMAGLQWLSSGMRPNDVAMLWMSGHGCQVPNRNGEPDGLSEAFCPQDFDWSREKMIIDKDFVRTFANMTQGTIFCWGSDSCHSGDLDREMSPPPASGATKLWRMAFGSPFISRPKTMPAPSYIANSVRRLKALGVPTRSITNGMLDVGFISGCMSNQTSADTEMDGKPCGALTYYFLKNLKQAPGLQLDALCDLITSDLVANGYEQKPQTDGSRANKPWLSN